MIDKLIDFSIKNKLVIGLFVLGLIAWGSYSLKHLPIDAVPDITNNQVQIITIAPSIAAQEVERLISFPIERTMATIPEIQEIRSFSRFGMSSVTIVFNENTDIYWARQQVNERLNEARNSIPKGIGDPSLTPVTTGLGEIYQYALHTKKGYEDKYSAMELRSIQDWLVKPQLLGTKGVADVSSFGGFLKQYEVAIDPNQLKASNVTITEVFTALQKNNQNTGGAYIDKKPNAYFIRTEGLISSLEDIEKIVVKKTSQGQPVLIRDLATVDFGHATRYGATTRNGEGEVVSSIVMMLKGENSADVIASVKERIAQIEKTLPEGVVIEPFLDRTKLVDSAIGTVAKNLIEGALIVLFILILFLGSFRAGLVVASVIPLAMLFAIAMMNLFGVSGNLMSLGAIDFGLIVDGAVIIVEAILHRLNLKKRSVKINQQEADVEVYAAASKIRTSAAFGEIIILIVYLPILALVGIEGKMFGPMAQTVSFAILGAFILSLTYVPMMSALVLRNSLATKRNFSDRLMDFFTKLYQPMLRFALRNAFVLCVVGALLFSASLFVFSRLGGEFIPSLDEGDFAVEMRLLSGSSLSETIDASLKAQKIILRDFPEVEQVVGKIGSGEIPTDPMPIEACDMMIILKDKSEWTSAEGKDELAEKMQHALEEIPGVSFGFQQPIQMRFNELMTGARQDVVVKIYGDDLDLLSSYAKKVADQVKKVEGATDLYVEEVTGLPQIMVEYNRGSLAQFGLSIEDVNTAIETSFAGKSAGVIYEGEKRFDLVLKLGKESRSSIEDVANLFVSTSDGHQIPLNQVATVSFKDGPIQIQRDDAKRRITVGFNVRDRDVESIVEELKGKIEENIVFDPGYYPTFGGQFENLIEARGRLSVAVPIALLMIFVLLYFTFKSVQQSILIFTAIPLSAIGGIFALWLANMPFSISAGVGFIALFGVAVLNGIVLIGEFNYLKKDGMELMERIKLGTEHRLRPVLMTALVASCGFLPMALSHSSGAEVQRPLATVVIGGLISATLLTLILLPILYMYLEQGKLRLRFWKSTPVAVAIVLSFNVFSQNESVTLHSSSEAIDVALSNTERMKAATFSVEWANAQRKSSLDIAKTDVTWQHGQYNSVFKNDNYFSVSQSFLFPTVYSNQAKWYDAQIKGKEADKSIEALKISREVKENYSRVLYLKEKIGLSQHLDSNYQRLQATTKLKLDAGDIGSLDLIIAETNAQEISNQLSNAYSDLKTAIQRLKLSMGLNSDIELKIEDESFSKSLYAIEKLKQEENALLASFREQIRTTASFTQLQKSKLLPDLTVGYFNQSLTGNQTVNGVDTYFGTERRFQGFQVGIAIPIWSRPQVAKIEMARLEQSIAESNLILAQKQLQYDYFQAFESYEKEKKNVEFYQGSLAVQADKLMKNATVSYKNGEINQADFLQILNQYTSIRIKALEAFLNYHMAIIQLEYLTGN